MKGLFNNDNVIIDGILVGYKLSNAERRIVKAILGGVSNYPTLGKILELSPNTIKLHMKSILKKVGVDNKTDLVVTLCEELVYYKQTGS